MKKFSFLALAAASLMLASCSNDEDLQGTVPDGTPVEVTFTTQLPNDIATRAYGEGKQAKDLYYAVYTKGGDYLFQGTGSFPATELQTTVTIQLVTGAEYQVVFWAQNEDAPYKFNAEAKTMTIDYTTNPVVNNNENLDAFYVNKSIKVNANQLEQQAVLTRPFAQINIATGDKAVVMGTKDDEGNYITKPLGTYPTQSQVTLSNVPNVLNLLDGTVDGDAEVNLAYNAIPEGQITVGGVAYDYLSMSYVLAPTEGDVINSVQMNVDSYPDNFVYTNIPVKRNYRTNIVGDLLTTKTLWNVRIDPIFNEPSLDNYIVVGTAAELTSAIAAGEDVFLSQDITLSGAYLTTTGDTAIDLGGNKLTLAGSAAVVTSNNAELNLSNGDLECNRTSVLIQSLGTSEVTMENVNLTLPSMTNGVVLSKGNSEVTLTDVTLNCPSLTNTAIFAQDNSTVTISNVELTAGNATQLAQGSENATIVADNVTLNVPNQESGVNLFDHSNATISNCDWNLKYYCVSTNASEPSWNHNLSIENCTFSASCAVLINIPGTYSIKNSKLNGITHGLFARGGDITVEGGEINLVYNDATDYAEDQTAYFDTTWGQGGQAPISALTVGNRSTSYQYATNLTLKGVSVNVKGEYNKFYTVYAWANEGAGLGVNFKYDAATSFNGGKGLFYGNNGANITVN